MMAATTIAPSDLVHGEHPSTADHQQDDNGDMAPLPPTYVALPQATKLEEEPNPFEKSFSDVSAAPRPVLPPVSSIATPPRSANKDLAAGQLTWDSIHTGPLTPTLLSGTNTTAYPQISSVLTMHTLPALAHSHDEAPHQAQSLLPPSESQASSDQVYALKVNMYDREPAFINHTQDTMPTRVNRARPRHDLANSGTADLESGRKPTGRSATKRKSQSSKDIDDEEKRKNFLERNRQAALKCRQRKKLWLQDMQAKVEYLTVDNEQLHLQADALREEVMNLRTLLLTHKDCPVSQQETIDAIRRPLPAYEASVQPSDMTLSSEDQQPRQQQRQHLLTALTAQSSGAPASMMNA